MLSSVGGSARATESSDIVEFVCGTCSALYISFYLEIAEEDVPMTPLHPPRLLQTPLHQPRSSRINILDMAMGCERAQDQFDLWSLVWVVLELRVVEKWIKYSKVGMSQLKSVSSQILRGAAHSLSLIR
jgi:hypothetical protein